MYPAELTQADEAAERNTQELERGTQPPQVNNLQVRGNAPIERVGLAAIAAVVVNTSPTLQGE